MVLCPYNSPCDISVRGGCQGASQLRAPKHLPSMLSFSLTFQSYLVSAHVLSMVFSQVCHVMYLSLHVALFMKKYTLIDVGLCQAFWCSATAFTITTITTMSFNSAWLFRRWLCSMLWICLTLNTFNLQKKTSLPPDSTMLRLYPAWFPGKNSS